jgi:long-chain acyl-CoA synthetase
MVPTMFHRMLSLPDLERRSWDLSSLQGVLHGAAPCPVEVKHRMIEWLGPIVNEYYGSSEGGGALVRSEEWLARPGTVGLPWPGSTIKVLDESGQDCPPGTTGTVHMQMSGWDFEYHNDPDKTQQSVSDGFFTVGDVGHLDSDGYLYLSGRTAELIISGGTNIYPAEIEGVLLEHPAVADAAVIGVPNEEWGEEVKAVLELKPGVTPGPELTAEVLAHCRTRLAGFKVPRSVEYRAALPRTDAGKLLKRLLVQEHQSA